MPLDFFLPFAFLTLVFSFFIDLFITIFVVFEGCYFLRFYKYIKKNINFIINRLI